MKIRQVIEEGKRYFKKKQYEKAADCFSSISCGYEQYVMALSYLGTAYLRLKKTDRAASIFTKMLQIDSVKRKENHGYCEFAKKKLKTLSENGNELYEQGLLLWGGKKYAAAYEKFTKIPPWHIKYPKIFKHVITYINLIILHNPTVNGVELANQKLDEFSGAIAQYGEHSPHLTYDTIADMCLLIAGYCADMEVNKPEQAVLFIEKIHPESKFYSDAQNQFAKSAYLAGYKFLTKKDYRQAARFYNKIPINHELYQKIPSYMRFLCNHPNSIDYSLFVSSNDSREYARKAILKHLSPLLKYINNQLKCGEKYCFFVGEQHNTLPIMVFNMFIATLLRSKFALKECCFEGSAKTIEDCGQEEIPIIPVFNYRDDYSTLGGSIVVKFCQKTAGLKIAGVDHPDKTRVVKERALPIKTREKHVVRTMREKQHNTLLIFGYGHSAELINSGIAGNKRLIAIRPMYTRKHVGSALRCENDKKGAKKLAEVMSIKELNRVCCSNFFKSFTGEIRDVPLDPIAPELMKLLVNDEGCIDLLQLRREFRLILNDLKLDSEEVNELSDKIGTKDAEERLLLLAAGDVRERNGLWFPRF